MAKGKAGVIKSWSVRFKVKFRLGCSPVVILAVLNRDYSSPYYNPYLGLLVLV